MDCFNAAYLLPLQHLPPSWYLSCLHIEISLIWYDLVFIAKRRKAFAHYSGMVVSDILLWEATQCVRVRWELAPLYPPPRIQVPPPSPLPGTIQLYPPQRDRGITPLLLGGIISHPPQIKTQVTTGNSCNVRYLIRKTLEYFGLFFKRQRNPLTTEGSWLKYPGKMNPSS